MFDITDVYGLVNYFVPSFIVTIAPAMVNIKDDLGIDKKVACWEMSFINDKKIYITEEVRRSFMQPEYSQEQGSAPSGDRDLEE